MVILRFTFSREALLSLALCKKIILFYVDSMCTYDTLYIVLAAQGAEQTVAACQVGREVLPKSVAPAYGAIAHLACLSQFVL
jgi:hypothetical protein